MTVYEITGALQPVLFELPGHEPGEMVGAQGATPAFMNMLCGPAD